jgi:hypothetical protein
MILAPAVQGFMILLWINYSQIKSLNPTATKPEDILTPKSGNTMSSPFLGEG